MAERNPSLWLQNRTDHTAENDRALLTTLFREREGVSESGHLKVSQRSAGANMSVDVAAGRAIIKGDDASSTQGMYHVWNDAVKNLTIAASDPTNPRKDIVIAIVRDAFYAGATNAWALEVVTGTPAASPSEPSVPNNAIKLAVVTVAASATSVTDANITDSRVVVPAAGGQFRGTAAQRAASTGHAVGDEWYETDNHRVLYFDGTNWVRRGTRWNANAAIIGTVPTATQKRENELILQSGTFAATTSSAGGMTVTFPEAFPNGVFSIIVAQGDTATGGAAEMVGVEGVTLASFIARWYEHDGNPSANQARRVNWVAVGW